MAEDDDECSTCEDFDEDDDEFDEWDSDFDFDEMDDDEFWAMMEEYIDIDSLY